MKCPASGGSLLLLLLLSFLCPLALVPSVVCELPTDSENELSQEENQEELGRLTQQQGSWSHWWSYDGISGPDYWNINKRWRLCGSGQRQSPVEVRTERLVYDHLLGPFRLTWLGPEQAGWRSGEEKGPGPEQDNERQRDQEQASTVGAQLLNSGRGLELWLEAPDRRRRRPPPSDQLMLSGGPLSYHYKLYKLELHSAAGKPASEHLIDGRSFDAELQLHFYNRHLAGSALEAQRMAEGDTERPAAPSASLYAIISVFLVLLADDDEPNHHQRQSPIDFMLNQTLAEGDSSELTLTRGQLERLVPSRGQYITYQGSLNRPPCAELADWLLVNQALKVHVHKFHSSLANYQENIRPVRALNGRQLRTTIDLAGARHREARRGSCETKLNCSQQQQQEQPAPIGACSMRPQYVYQLSQGIRN